MTARKRRPAAALMALLNAKAPTTPGGLHRLTLVRRLPASTLVSCSRDRPDLVASNVRLSTFQRPRCRRIPRRPITTAPINERRDDLSNPPRFLENPDRPEALRLRSGTVPARLDHQRQGPQTGLHGGPLNPNQTAQQLLSDPDLFGQLLDRSTSVDHQTSSHLAALRRISFPLCSHSNILPASISAWLLGCPLERANLIASPNLGWLEF